MEKIAFALAPVFPHQSGRQRLLAQRIHRQRFIQPQSPAGDVACRIAHQARGVLLVDQNLIAVHLAVGGVSARHGEETLARHAPHRGKLADRRHHQAQLVAALDAKLRRQLFAEDNVVLARLQHALRRVDQIRRERIFFVGLNAEHHADRHVMRAL